MILDEVRETGRIEPHNRASMVTDTCLPNSLWKGELKQE